MQQRKAELGKLFDPLLLNESLDLHTRNHKMNRKRYEEDLNTVKMREMI